MDRELLARRLEAWQFEPASVRLHRLADQARSVAQRLGKSGLQVKCVADPLRFKTEAWGEFWSSFSHLLRNAVDHGIEEPEERRAKGKTAEGELTLECRRLAGEVEISLSDDGRGLDWERIRQAAKAAHLPCENQDQLKAALFHDGLTTKTCVNEFSGRGVGMGAVKRASDRLNGVMSIESVAGQGTVIRFRFPEAALVAGTDGFVVGMAVGVHPRSELAS
jgi:two-component system chemotaxis sensor kinase CheA